jgi:hypothetical protein
MGPLFDIASRPGLCGFLRILRVLSGAVLQNFVPAWQLLKLPVLFSLVSLPILRLMFSQPCNKSKVEKLKCFQKFAM